jgi:hypothetical protein
MSFVNSPIAELPVWRNGAAARGAALRSVADTSANRVRAAMFLDSAVEWAMEDP